MPDLSLLTDRYGPLPGYAWAGVAGVGAFLLIRHRAASSSTSPADTSTSDDNEPPEPVEYDPAGNYLPPPPAAVGADTPNVPAPAPRPHPRRHPRPAKHPHRPPPARQPTGRVAKHHRVYTVRRGDTLISIARHFKVTLRALLRANPQIKNPSLIHIGEKVTIPG